MTDAALRDDAGREVAAATGSADRVAGALRSAAMRLLVRDGLGAACVLAVLLGLAIRVTVLSDAPFSVDETFTGAIAAQTSLGAVVGQILDDVNSPAYYLLAHAWSLAFGLSDRALRAPALIFGAAAPLLCLIPSPALARRTRLLWCALTALWIPGFVFSEDARCYTMVFCLSLAGTLAFVALLEDPTRRRALVWALIGAGAILTHYLSLILIGGQAMVFLFRWRGRALRTWPAALVFAPVAVWLAIHSERIVTFTSQQSTWYHRVGIADLLAIAAFLASDIVVAVGLVVLGVFTLLGICVARAQAVPPGERSRASVRLAAAAALASVVVLLVLAALRPSFTPRYLVVFAPGLLLGLALLGEARVPLRRLMPALLVATFASGAAHWAFADHSRSKLYGFEPAADAAVAAGTRRLVFLWDNPNNHAEDPSQLAAVGGFFFARRALPVDVVPVKLTGEDPNRQMLALAAAPHSAIIWVYDLAVAGTAARRFPPAIETLDPHWRCRDWGERNVGVLACLPRP